MATGADVGAPYPSDEDDDLNQSVAQSAGPTPFGALAIIPRELRDEIYRLSLAVERSPQDVCFCGKWTNPCYHRGYGGTCYFWYQPSSPYENRMRKTSSQKWQGGCLTLLGVSLAIRAEALHTLHTWGHFMFPEPYHGRKVEPYAIPFLHFISDLRFRFIIDRPGPRYLGEPLSCTTDYQETIDTPACPLSYFTGHDTQRKTCAVEIWYSRSHELHKLLQSPLCNAIRKLTGFEKVILVFTFEKERTGQHSGATNYDGTDIAAFSAVTKTFATALENELGPSTSTDISHCWQWRIRDMFYHTMERSIEFYPRTYLSRRHVSSEPSQQAGTQCNR